MKNRILPLACVDDWFVPPNPTPLVELALPSGLFMYLKLEGEHDAGSHKGRAIGERVRILFQTGRIGRLSTTLLISSSGQAAWALAKATVDVLRLKVVVVTDALSPPELTARLRQFAHVELHVVNQPDASGSHLLARFELMERLKQEHPNVIVIDQYADDVLPLTYQNTLVREVITQTDGQTSSIWVPSGTCAMLRGFDLDKRDHVRRYKLIGVDAAGSSLHRPAPAGMIRRLSGYGNAKPTQFARELETVDGIAHVDDVSVVRTARRLLSVHDLFLGPSSCAAITAVIQASVMRPELLPHWGVPVVICPDYGTPYLKTLYDDDWCIHAGLGRGISMP